MTYDPNGNLTQKTENGEVWGYEWNARNELTRVTKDSVEVATFKYDPLGRRIEKQSSAAAYTYVYDGMDVLQQTAADGVSSLTYRFIHGPEIDEPLEKRDDGSGVLTYYHADGLGSVVKTTDGTGSVVESRDYDAWGVPDTGGIASGYAFAGREWDAETGLYFNRARYYDPAAGRFLSEDPLGFLAGINFYAYASGNPQNFTDPLGLADNSINAAIRNGNVDALKALADNPGLSTATKQRIAQALQRLRTPVRDLVRGRLKRSKSYASQYEDLTLEELIKLSRTNKEAARLLKLVNQEARLMDKIRGFFVGLLGLEESEEVACEEETEVQPN